MIHVVHLVIYALSVLVAAKVVPGIQVRSFWSALFFAFVLAILNRLLFKALVFFSFPMVLVTFGLFIFVINAFLFWLADKVVDGVRVNGFGAALLGSLVTSLINAVINWALRHHH
jgi:putative membrane protein